MLPGATGRAGGLSNAHLDRSEIQPEPHYFTVSPPAQPEPEDVLNRTLAA